MKMKYNLVVLVILAVFSFSCGDGEDKMNSSDVVGLWRVTFEDVNDSCYEEIYSGTITSQKFIVVRNDIGSLLKVSSLSLEGDETFEDYCINDSFYTCEEDEYASGSNVLVDNSIVVYEDEDVNNLEDLEWESDNYDCKWITTEKQVVNFKNKDEAEVVYSASSEAKGSDCDSEVFNDYLNEDREDMKNPLNLKNCTFYLKQTLIKVGEIPEEE